MLKAEEVYAMLKGKGVSQGQIDTAVEKYLTENPVTVSTDKTLTKENVAADAKATGNAITSLNEEKANGKGISFSINESGGLRVTYDDGK